MPSYSVGFEKIVRMYPMGFLEFAYANGIQNDTIEYLNDCFKNLKKINNSIHKTFLKLFYAYIAIGGMPECVQIYKNSTDSFHLECLTTVALLRWYGEYSDCQVITTIEVIHSRKLIRR